MRYEQEEAKEHGMMMMIAKLQEESEKDEGRSMVGFLQKIHSSHTHQQAATFAKMQTQLKTDKLKVALSSTGVAVLLRIGF